MTSTFCTSGACLLKAGKNVSTDFSTGTPGGQTATAAIDQLINQAESYLNTLTRINYTDTYASLNGDVKKILEDAASCHAALAMVTYDTSSYTSRAEAQTILNVCYARLTDAVQLLREKQFTNFIDEGE